MDRSQELAGQMWELQLGGNRPGTRAARGHTGMGWGCWAAGGAGSPPAGSAAGGTGRALQPLPYHRVSLCNGRALRLHHGRASCAVRSRRRSLAEAVSGRRKIPADSTPLPDWAGEPYSGLTSFFLPSFHSFFFPSLFFFPLSFFWGAMYLIKD